MSYMFVWPNWKTWLSRSEGHGEVWSSKIVPGMKQAILCVLLCTQDQVEHRKAGLLLILIVSATVAVVIVEAPVATSSSSCMCVMNHNWSATKQRLYPQISRDKPPFSFVRGRDSTMWDIVWVSPQGHRSVSVSRHFLLQTPQCPCSMRKWFSRDHCCRGRSKPGCQIVGSHTRWELTTWADFQISGNDNSMTVYKVL